MTPRKRSSKETISLATPTSPGSAIAARSCSCRRRLLTALKEAGKTELLDSLLKEFGDSFDRPNMEGLYPYRCDFLKLRDKALGAFAK